VLIDIKRAPGFQDLLPPFQLYPASLRGLAREWLRAAVHEIDPPPAVDALEVVHHQP
jgi:hypothetical protein